MKYIFALFFILFGFLAKFWFIYPLIALKSSDNSIGIFYLFKNLYTTIHISRHIDHNSPISHSYFVILNKKRGFVAQSAQIFLPGHNIVRKLLS